jgi:hypothetical protein
MTHDVGTTDQTAPAAQRQGNNGLAIAGLVCGLVGLLLFWFVLGPLAIIFGGVGLSRAKRGAGHRGMAIAAIVLGVIDIVVYLILLVAVAKNGGAFAYHLG